MEHQFTFIGPLALGTLPKNGETAKNQILYDFLYRKYKKISIVDTSNWRWSGKVLVKLLISLLGGPRNKILVISICTQSAFYLTKLLFFSGIRKNLNYFVIGNTILQGIENKKYNPKYYSIYSKIFVEGKVTCQKLKTYGLNNIVYLPNFKKIDKQILSIKKSIINNAEPVRFVFLSRITEEKGVSLIFDAIEKMNLKNCETKFNVTFFGPINNEYEAYFNQKINSIQNAFYGGYLNLQNKAGYEILSSFHIMLFPSFWYGEGFPGIFVDAFISGLPIIASDWNLNNEVIEDNHTGFIINSKNSEMLEDRMLYFMENPDDIRRMGDNCKSKALLFDIDEVMKNINLVQT